MADEDTKKPRKIIDRTGQWAGKPLSALCQILRSAGMAEYELIEERQDGTKTTVRLKLGPPPAPKRPGIAIDVSTPTDDDEAPPDDFRFGLERQMSRHFPSVKADPRKNRDTGS